ncbi:MAG: hypothetical protein LBQ23_01245 [Puniceicoccales bacterium]|nr:hypothetical protein [Puniceicoccales bacterium]
MGKLDGKELNDAFKAIYELLGNSTNRRKIFINKLPIPCAKELKSEAGKHDGKLDTFIGLYEKFLALNRFCTEHKFICTEKEFA